MAGIAMSIAACLRIPPDVEFERWEGGGEWVLYHSGTGETIRLSDAALALLDLLVESGPLDRPAMARALNAMMDAPLADAEMVTALEGLLGELLAHECVEPVSCD